MIDFISRWLLRLTITVAFASIFAVMCMTVGDIVVRQSARMVEWVTGSRPSWGLRGLVDLSQLMIMSAASVGMGVAFIYGTHVSVDLVTSRLRDSTQNIALLLASCLGLCLMGACLWAGYMEFRNQLDFPATSATLGLSYSYYWVPLLAGIALSTFSCAYTTLHTIYYWVHDL